MIAIGVGFAVFLVETRVGSRAVRVRSELLQHRWTRANRPLIGCRCPS